MTSIKERIRTAVSNQALDWLYLALATFTYIYFFAIAALFFTRRGGYFLVLTRALSALSQPYLGSVGVYTILKEIRKRRAGEEGKHWGQLFVFLWTALLIASSILVIFSRAYIFDEIASVIITIGLGIFIIYLGALIHKP
ncbi:MAG: hypothetical protein WAP51_05015 [Candidatus Sungiibacteriota bacterium]